MVLHANAGIINQKGHAARGIDLVVGTARGTRFRLDNLNAVLEFLSQERGCALTARMASGA